MGIFYGSHRPEDSKSYSLSFLLLEGGKVVNDSVGPHLTLRLPFSRPALFLWCLCACRSPVKAIVLHLGVGLHFLNRALHDY